MSRIAQEDPGDNEYDSDRHPIRREIRLVTSRLDVTAEQGFPHPKSDNERQYEADLIRPARRSYTLAMMWVPMVKTTYMTASINANCRAERPA